MESRKSKLLWYGITTLIFAALLYFADLGRFLVAIYNTEPLYFSAALVSGLSFFPVIAYVWHRVFRQADIEVSYPNSLKMFLAGNFLNSITPLGQFGGEPLMAYVVSKKTGASYEKSLSCVVSSDMINAVPLVTYLLAGMLYISIFGEFSNLLLKITYLAIPLILSGIIFAYLLWFEDKILEEFLIGMINQFESKIGRGEKYLRSARDRIREMKKSFQNVGEERMALAKNMIFPHIAIGFQFLSLYFIFLGQGINPTVVSTYLIVIVSAAATFSPTPGGSGTFEAVFIAITQVFYPGIGFDTALAAAVLFRLTTYWPGIPIGYIALLKLRGERN